MAVTAEVSEFQPDPPAKSQRHPAGLYVLFGAEMWERFSYYGMRALLILYLTKYLKIPEATAKETYGTYIGLVYFTPLLGGFLADSLLGQRKAILVGGIVMALGHFAMAFESQLYLALGLLILGNGFFKPNISTMVGQLYPQGDSRRDAAYTIFYVGINLGAFFSPLVCGTLGERLGWHYGFSAAGVGMVLGLLSFLFFQSKLVGGYPPGRGEKGQERLTAIDFVHVVLVSLACLGVAYGIANSWDVIQAKLRVVVPGIVVGYGAFLIFTLIRAGSASLPETKEVWQRVAVILIVGLASVMFWMAFEQAGGTLTLFAEKNTNREIGGTTIPASLFQSINPFLIFTLAPLFSILWTRLDQTRFKLTSTAKMGVGLILLGVGCIIMGQANSIASTGVKVGPQWLTFTYLFFTLGELCLSPIGLSLVNKLAPAKAASVLMAVWFLCTAIANYLSGVLEEVLKEYHISLWPFLVGCAMGTGVILLLFTGPLKRMSHGRL